MAQSLRRILAASTLAHAVQDGMSATIYVLMPVLAQSLGLSLTQVGLFRGLKDLAQGLLELASGHLSERFNDRGLLLVGLALTGAGYLLFSVAGGALLVVVALLAVGLGTALQHVPASTLISQSHDETGRRRALGLYNASGDTGKLIFSGLFGLLVGAGLAWQATTVLWGGATLLAGIAIWVLLPRPARREATENAVEAAPGWGILHRTRFTALMTAIGLDSLVQVAMATFAPFLMLEKGLALEWAVLAGPAVLIGGIFGKAACGYLAAQLGPRAAFLLIQSLTVMGLLAVVFTPPLVTFLLFPLLGVVLQGSSTVTYGMVGDFVHPSRVARGFALIYAVGSLTGLAGPVLVGLIGDAQGVASGLIFLAAVSALSLLPGLWLRPVSAGASAAG